VLTGIRCAPAGPARRPGPSSPDSRHRASLFGAGPVPQCVRSRRPTAVVRSKHRALGRQGSGIACGAPGRRFLWRRNRLARPVVCRTASARTQAVAVVREPADHPAPSALWLRCTTPGKLLHPEFRGPGFLWAETFQATLEKSVTPEGHWARCAQVMFQGPEVTGTGVASRPSAARQPADQPPGIPWPWGGMSRSRSADSCSTLNGSCNYACALH